MKKRVVKKVEVVAKNSRKFDLKVLVVCMLIVYVVAGIGSIFTGNATKSDWYESVKPSITPPNYVFPIAWTILFFLIGLSMYYSWINSNEKEERKTVIYVFGANFILNILWSVLYFGMRNPQGAFVEIILIWISIVTMIYATWKINKKASWLLVPYWLWVSFAAVLNYLTFA